MEVSDSYTSRCLVGRSSSTVPPNKLTFLLKHSNSKRSSGFFLRGLGNGCITFQRSIRQLGSKTVHSLGHCTFVRSTPPTTRSLAYKIYVVDFLILSSMDAVDPSVEILLIRQRQVSHSTHFTTPRLYEECVFSQKSTAFR